MNKLIASVLVLVAGAALVFTFTGHLKTLGASPGPDHYVHQFFRASFTTGGRVATSSAATSQVLAASNLTQDYYRIDFTPNVVGITLTTAASSSLKSIIPQTGDSRGYLFCNATTTASQPFTFAAGTGVNLQKASTTAAIATGKCAQVIFTRKANSDIDALFNPYL